MPNVLFVCTANICRSPMAEAALRAELIERTAEGYWTVSSAGVFATPGEMPTPEAIQAMAECGYSVRDHRSRMLDHTLADAADLILVMTRAHRETVQARFPEHAHKVHLLSEMIGADFDISDPYGGSLARYRSAAAQLIQLIKDGYGTIVESARAARRP